MQDQPGDTRNSRRHRYGVPERAHFPCLKVVLAQEGWAGARHHMGTKRRVGEGAPVHQSWRQVEADLAVALRVGGGDLRRRSNECGRDAKSKGDERRGQDGTLQMAAPALTIHGSSGDDGDAVAIRATHCRRIHQVAVLLFPERAYMVAYIAIRRLHGFSCRSSRSVRLTTATEPRRATFGAPSAPVAVMHPRAIRAVAAAAF